MLSETQLPPVGESMLNPKITRDLAEDYDKHDQKYEDSLSIFTASDENASDRTESSDEMDAQLIMEHPIPLEEVQRIQKKETIPEPAKNACDSLLESQLRIAAGIPVTKLNWSNSKRKDVILRLTRNMKELTYMKPQNKLTCWDKVRGKGSIYLSEIAEMAYGAITSTFARVSPGIIRKQAIERPNIRRLFKHYDDRRDFKVMLG